MYHDVQNCRLATSQSPVKINVQTAVP